MGRGNSCVFGDYEGLYYIDNKYFQYTDEEDNTIGDYSFLEEELKLFEATLKLDFIKRFPSFYEADRWEWERLQGEKIILENELFALSLQDNGWSVAVKLEQKDNPYPYDRSIEGLQKRHFKNYMQGLKEVLFMQFNELGVYGGPWTSGRIRKGGGNKGRVKRLFY